MDYTGQKIEKYIVKRLIGEGGMASVYEAEHEVLGTKAAIKILNPVLTANADIRERFMNEAKMMASFQHTNITKIIDFEESDTFLAIIMEYLEGQDLSELIESGAKLSDKEISNIFEQTLSAFQYAHEKGVIHRDIKPSNIYLLPNGKVKILDFGIAKLFGQGNEKTQAGTQMGTPIYMSPEQVKADKSIDHRSDIYSLGVTLYFALNGKSPYDSDGASQFDIFNKIVYEPLPELAGESPLFALVKKACHKDRDQRYQSCEEWLEDLKAINKGNDLSDVKKTVKSEQTANDKTKTEEPIQSAKKVEVKSTNNQNATNTAPQSSGAALASLITGIIGLFLSWIPFLGFFLGLISIILGAVGQKDKQKLPSSNKSSGIAGIVLGSITMIIGITFILLFFIGVAAANEFNNLESSDNVTEATYTEYPATDNAVEELQQNSISDTINSSVSKQSTTKSSQDLSKNETRKEEKSKKVNNDINFNGLPYVVSSIKINPSPRQGSQNVFFDKRYTLFDQTYQNTPIFPVNKNGNIVYQIYYSSNENPKPFYGEFTPEQLERHLFYKFKNLESCMVFCNSR
jgi:serine/threonine protein kinase